MPITTGRLIARMTVRRPRPGVVHNVTPGIVTADRVTGGVIM
jgi:hypothetical protein